MAMERRRLSRYTFRQICPNRTSFKPYGPAGIPCFAWAHGRMEKGAHYAYREILIARQSKISSGALLRGIDGMSDFCRIADDVKLGDGVVVQAFVNLYGCEIGSRTKIGTFVEIQRGVIVGKECKISSHTFVCEGVTLEDGVFIGHNVTFINDRYPASRNESGKLKNRNDWTCEPILVKEGASIGSGSTILCGVVIGEKAVIGAGTVVTHSVPPGETWAGNPARRLRK
jgi:UDP-2-acetamido-3-amino-2,3-dideoxy-glucuronate N-acetyltransferase